MEYFLNRWLVIVLISIMSLSMGLHAELKIAGIFSDHMILQRDQSLPVWGLATPSEKITVSLAGQTLEANADHTGFWKLVFDPIKAGGPYELVVGSGEQSIVIRDILIGEVWLCSGQSNMEWPLELSLGGDAEVIMANHKNIRLFKVEKSARPDPRSDLEEEKWMVCTPENAAGITAVGYFFVKELQQELDIPIGILESAWGGTRAEAWTEFSFLEQEPELRSLADQYLESKSMSTDQQQQIIDRYEAWR